MSSTMRRKGAPAGQFLGACP